MRTYTVADIAELLQVNKETVRRWIRSGDLNATLTANKTGHIVYELDLFEFIQTKKPKYKKRSVETYKPQIDDIYMKTLNDMLTDMIRERDLLNIRISKLQSMLEEL